LSRVASPCLTASPSAVRRVVRPLIRGIGLPCKGTVSDGMHSITADEINLVISDGTRETWTRAPAD
jgi:hypothetical protein